MESKTSGKQLNGGILRGFIEESVELPSDGLNGECRVAFGGDHSDCEMKVNMVNGKREGEAMILKNGKRYYRMEYVGGELTGLVERFDEGGNVELRGHLMTGVERGLYKEYKNGIMTWMGCLNAGYHYSTVMESEYMKGMYVERRIDDGAIVSIAQYDDELSFKNGYCTEIVNGEMVECVYENGEMKPRSSVLVDERKRDHRSEEKEDGSKRVCVDTSTIPTENSLMQYDMTSHYEYGVWMENGKCYELRRSLYENRLLEGDLNSHEMRVYEENELKVVLTGENGCIDLSASGKRWEGGVKNGRACGYGVLFNEEGRKEYEGFMLNGMKCLYGVEYYDDIERVSYVGCFCDGARYGKGIEYDRNGDVVYDGMWRNNGHYSCEDENDVIDNRTESLNLVNSIITYSLCLPSFLNSLKRVVIGDESVRGIRELCMIGLNELESIRIGENLGNGRTLQSNLYSLFNRGGSRFNPSSLPSNSPRPLFSFSPPEEEKPHRKQCFYQIMNCPKLKSLEIGSDIFYDYESFELLNLPSLEFITMGENCFHDGCLCSMKSKEKESIIK